MSEETCNTNNKNQKGDFDKLKLKVEAILFSYGDWITSKEIMNTLSMDSELLIKNTLQELKSKYDINYSFQVEQNENLKWRMALNEEYEDVVTDLISNVEIPQPALKVLSIIAYEQPVTKTRLGEILGKAVKKEVAYLYRNKFISYEKKGIGKYYRVTKKFFDYFKIDEDEDFREQANKNITHYLEEFDTSKLSNSIDKNIKKSKK